MSPATLTTSPNSARVRFIDLHPGQREIIQSAARFNVLACGRRFGKTKLGLQRTHHPLTREAQPVGWFSPTYKLLSEVWREAIEVYAPITAARNVQEHRLQLTTGGVLEFWSLDDADPARGRKYRRVIVDEAGMVKNLADAWQGAIRPTLTDYQGDAWFLSTPRGLNYFYQLYQLGQDAAQPEWQAWRKPTSDNPYIVPAEIEAARNELPERVFAQEYLAEFLSDAAAVFRKVLEAATLTPQPRQDGHTYVLGADWGKHNDFTVFSVLDGCCKKQVYLERTNRIDYVVQVQRLEHVAAQYRCQLIVAEANSMGEPVIEMLRRKRLRVHAWTATNATKARLVETLQIGFEHGSLKILNDPTQTGELLAFDQERLPSGLIRYGAPEGMHDDTVIALGLSYLACAQQQPKARLHAFAFGEED